jgi:hypothetical protein
MSGDETVTITIKCPVTELSVSTKYSILQADLSKITAREFHLEHIRLLVEKLNNAVKLQLNER